MLKLAHNNNNNNINNNINNNEVVGTDLLHPVARTAPRDDTSTLQSVPQNTLLGTTSSGRGTGQGEQCVSVDPIPS